MAKKDDKNKASGEKVICRNRRASFDYEILDRLEAGIVLTGTEVKSLRAGKANLEDSFARLEGSELFLFQSEIPEYAMGNRMNHEPRRKRKLLLHRREIEKFAKGARERGFTIVPLRFYFRDGLAKVELALATGKRQFDKRESLKKKEANRVIEQAMRRRR